MPAAMAVSTARAALLLAAGQMAGASAPAVVLMKGVMKIMLLKKLRLTVGAVMVLLALGAVGLGYRAGDPSGAARAAPPDKPVSELEALRKENELLKLNLQVVLEKVRAQEAELRAARGQAAEAQRLMYREQVKEAERVLIGRWIEQGSTVPDVTAEAEAAVKALREAKDKEAQRRATEALEKALEKLKKQTKSEPPPAGPGKP
jgi:hypothetical protein